MPVTKNGGRGSVTWWLQNTTGRLSTRAVTIERTADVCLGVFDRSCGDATAHALFVWKRSTSRLSRETQAVFRFTPPRIFTVTFVQINHHVGRGTFVPLSRQTRVIRARIRACQPPHRAATTHRQSTNPPLPRNVSSARRQGPDPRREEGLFRVTKIPGRLELNAFIKEDFTASTHYPL